MSVLFSCSLFFLSFIPLWLSVLFVDIRNICVGDFCLKTEYMSIFCILVITIISSAILWNTMRSKNNRTGSTQYTILKAETEKTITSEFLLSYILPLFAFDFTKWYEVVLFLIYFIILGFLCVKHDYFSVNILLELAKYHFYKCELENSDGEIISKIVISRDMLNGSVGETVYLKPLNNNFQLKIK